MHSKTRLLSIAGAATMAVALTACGSVDPYGANNYPASQRAAATYPSRHLQPARWPASNTAASPT